MTLLETIKQELDTLPEDMLIGILADINRKKRLTKPNDCLGWEDASDDDNMLSDTEYLASIPGMMEIIQKGIDTPLSECIPLEEVWDDV